MNERLSEDWISKINREYKEAGEKAASLGYKANNNLPSVKLCRKRYEKTEKGRIARKRVSKNRVERFTTKDITEEQRPLLQRFYAELPEGHVVDHIIPLAKGGKHCLSNLQWLKKEDNFLKAARTYFKPEDAPQCLVDISKWFVK